ncbi:class I SAM-dependent methyltransferase [soil metagenome]
MREVDDQVADDYADHFRTTEPEQPIELAMIDHFITTLLDPREVVDAGCGAGRMLPLLADRGCKVRGLDLSAGMLTRSRTDHPEFDTAQASITELPLSDASLDGLFYWYSIIHLPDPDLLTVFDEAARVLRPGGSVPLAFQAGQGPREVGEGFRRARHDVTLIRYDRSADTVSSRLAHAGLLEVARMLRDPSRRRTRNPGRPHRQEVP